MAVLSAGSVGLLSWLAKALFWMGHCRSEIEFLVKEMTISFELIAYFLCRLLFLFALFGLFINKFVTYK